MDFHNSITKWPQVVFNNNSDVAIPNESLVEHHSFVNLLNIIGLTVQYWEMDNVPTETSLQIHTKVIPDIIHWIKRHPDFQPRLFYVECLQLQQSFAQFLRECVSSTEEKSPLSILLDLDMILQRQLEDLKLIVEHSHDWRSVKTADIKRRVNEFLQAIAKNSNGRFAIVFDGKEEINASKDISYRVSLTCEGAKNGDLMIPTPFISTVQDLHANARKYSPVGSIISSTIANRDGFFMFEIQDNGYGIPEDELSKVVQYGFRGSNIKSIKSYGGGYGLTKALLTAKRYGGTMEIASQLNLGTRICLKIPLPTDA